MDIFGVAKLIQDIGKKNNKSMKYFKNKYPEDKEIDSKKLMNMDMVERSKQKLNLYLWFSSPEQFRKQNQNKNMTDEVYDKIKKAGPEFIKKLKYYFKLFKP